MSELDRTALATSDPPEVAHDPAAEAPRDLPLDDGRYEIGVEHARGGAGRVHRARDRRLERTVAVKSLAAEADRRATARFVREALVTARLQHPGIVPIYDAGRRGDGKPYYAMKLVAGRTLRDAVLGAASLDARLALLPHVLAIAEAVAFAHSEGVVHRDLKPSNVMLGDFGETVVVDWGLARDRRLGEPDRPDDEEASLYALTHTQVTRAGAIVGTPSFMSPEQARGEEVDERADVYAIGAILYYVLAARPPFEGDSDEVIARVAAEAPPALGTVVPGAPRDLLAIVAKAMARAPGARYPTARELAADLSRFLTGQLVGAREYGALSLLARWLRRNRVLATAIAVVLTIATLSFLRIRSERGVARAAAAHEKSRADAMILTQAETSLLRDPSRAIAWLKTYPLDGDEWPRLRAIARQAVSLGVARHALRAALAYWLTPWDEGRRLLLLQWRRKAFFALDVTSGALQKVCLPEALRDPPFDETFGHELLTLLVDGRLLVWNRDFSASELVADVPGATIATLSSDGRWVATTTASGLAALIDRRTGAQEPLGEGGLPITQVRFVPGTHRLLLLSEAGGARLYDVDGRQVVYAAMPGVIDSWVSPHGPQLVLVRRSAIEWLDAATLESHALPIKLAMFGPLDFLADGRVVIDERNQKGIKIWDPRRQGLVEVAGPLGSGVAASADGRRVGLVEDGVRKLWVFDTATGDAHGYSGHLPAFGRFTSFLADGMVASETEGGDLRLWDTTATKAAATIPLGARMYEPDFELVEDQRTLIMSAQDGRILRQRLPTGAAELLCKAEGEITSLAARADGGQIVATTRRGDLVGCDPASGRVELLGSGATRLTELVLTRDGRFALGFGRHAQRAVIWDLERRSMRELPVAASCMRLLLSPDQRTAAVDCPDEDSSFELVDVESGEVRRLPTPPDLSLADFSPSGRYLFATSWEGLLVRWDLASGQSARRQLDASNVVYAVALSDELVMTASDDGLRVSGFSLGISRLLDGKSVQERPVLSPDGTQLAYRNGSDELGGTFVRDLVSGERWGAIRHDRTRPVQLTRDRWMVVPCMDGNLRLYAPPGPQRWTPAETKAWLEGLTSMELEEARLPSPTCGE